jgi:repressor LexA
MHIIFMNILTKNEEKVLRIIQKLFSITHKMPTVREIRDESKKEGMKAHSLGTIFMYLKNLQTKGYINRSKDRKQRSITLTGEKKSMFITVPILGTISAGSPTYFAEQNIEGYLKVSSRLLTNRNVFGLHISGDSMNRCAVKGTKIDDGDYILIDPDVSQYHDGDVVAVIIDSVATAKIFKRINPRQIVLLPKSSNPIHQPIYLTPEDDFVVKGKVVGVLKNFR